MAVYEFRRGKTAKFWAPDVRGKQLFLRFGAIGKTGQTRVKDFATAKAAQAELERAVAEKLGDGYALAGGKPAKAKASEKPAVPAKQRTALLALAKQLGTAKVVREITMAIDAPAAFVDAYPQYETLEDVDYAEMPWLALIESLQEHGKLAEVDWKEHGYEVLLWLEKLGGAAAKRALKPARAEGEAIGDRYTHECLELFGRQLATQKLALISLHKESDSYPLMVVAAARVKALQQLAKTAGQEIEHYTGAKLAEYERDRQKELAKHSSTNPWTKLVADNEYHRTGSAVDSVLWNLNHESYIDKIRDVLPFAPKSARALLEMTIALYDQPATQLAKTVGNPALLLYALRYLNPSVPEHRYQRLHAAAMLADKLHVKPDGKQLHQQVLDACNVWNEGKATDKQLARLPAAARDRLARFGDAMLACAKYEGDEKWESAIRMLVTCGDEASLPGLAKAGERMLKKRRDEEWDLAGPFDWDKAAKSIAARMKKN